MQHDCNNMFTDNNHVLHAGIANKGATIGISVGVVGVIMVLIIITIILVVTVYMVKRKKTPITDSQTLPCKYMCSINVAQVN